MPVIVDLAPIAAALFWAGCCIAGYLLIRAIGHLLPNVSILGVGLNFANWFESAAGGVENWLVDRSKDAWRFAADMWHVMAHVFSTAFGDVVNAISHTGDNIVHLATQTIPRAIDTALNGAAAYTDQELGKVENKVVNAYNAATHGFDHAARSEFEALAHGAANVENNLLGIASHAVDTAISYTDGAIGQAEGILRSELHDAIVGVKGDIRDLHNLLAGQISDLVNTVASDYQSAKQIAQSDANAALSTAQGLISTVEHEVSDIANAAPGTITRLLQDAIGATDSTVASLTTTVGQDFTAAETQARNEVAAAVSTVTDSLNSAVGTLTDAITAAKTAAAAGVQSAIDQAQSDANTAIGTVTGTLENVLGGIAQDVQAGDQIYHGDLAGTATAVAAAITGAVAGVASRVATLERCAVGVCESSPNNFSKLLNDALGLAEAGGAFAYLAAAVTDPQGTATTTGGLLKPVADSGVSLLETLLGLPAI